MFQLWRLVLLCGLLTGTSASLLNNSVVTELQSALRKELEIDDSASESVLDQVKAGFEWPQNFTSLEKVVTEKIQEDEILLDKNITENIRLSGKPFVGCLSCIRLTIRSINMGNIAFQGTPGSPSGSLSIPITAKVTLTLPLLGAVVDLTLNFVLQTSISFKIGETGALMVVIGECTYRQARISLPFVNSSVSSLTVPSSNIRQTVTTLVNLVETYLVQDVLCPRIRTIISSSNENLIQNLKETLQETAQETVN
ncbi:short palate, lung and nasal epithelium carcinoma-associated protein 2A-like [Ovis canadensis]|uniref:short palate, lung and nasal epithelium carcinoma-associated protein 2A-like n=1 Tax=Ovis canadensis TaxID=37174 RepID=UPI0037519E3A